jgi:phosphoribosyl 1,2-cyclic phosphodiesterase
MKITFWGTRGSQATPGTETVRYGGNTACVEVESDDGAVLILDAGTGIRRLGNTMATRRGRVDILITHLHMDHIQGLGFFEPLYRDDLEVHIWGPASTSQPLPARLTRYLSPPLFPVRLRDLPCAQNVHDVPYGSFDIGPFRVTSELVCHPGPTVGYRIEADGVSMAYMPDHEPALVASEVGGLRGDPMWTSGFDLAHRVDVLIHDAQYTPLEYADRVGWGHSTVAEALDFARLAAVKHLVLFHFDPTHDDDSLDRMFADATAITTVDGMVVTAAHEGDTLTVPHP